MFIRPRRRPSVDFAVAILALLAIQAGSLARLSAADPAGLELFEKHVRPLLVEHCIRCHGEKKQQGGLRLDSREGWTVGGDSGPAIVPGEPQHSLLMQAIGYSNTDLEMPPQGKLPAATIEALENWVLQGAPDPREAVSTAPSGRNPPTVDEGRQYWAFQPIGRPSVPAVQNTAWPLGDIDRFILAGLEQQSIAPVADAADEDLVRRVYFDLIGLPPTPQQVSDYVNDPSPDAFENLVDRLLDSPQFGERWGRHWLSVVRYAESSGGGRTLLFPEAWRYRDYVIDCFNRDVPYDQFLREQIAGDLLEADDPQDRQRKLIATAFLLLGPTNYERQDKDALEMDVVDEQLDTLGKSMLGMTIGCARCHDHKFDPIPMHDYYALAGILRSTKAMIHSNVSQWNTVELPLTAEQEKLLAAHRKELDAANDALQQATTAWVAAGGKADSPADSKSIAPASLDGLVVDDVQAERIGQWTESTSTAGYVGTRYLHDGADSAEEKSVIYRPQLPVAGRYEVQMSYTAGANRSTAAQVRIQHSGGETVLTVDQRHKPEIDGLLKSLGSFEFDPTMQPQVVISNAGKQDGHVIADAVVFVSQQQPAVVKAEPESPAEKHHRQQLKQRVDELTQQVKVLQAAAPKPTSIMATVDDEDAGDIPLAIRGVVHNAGPIIPRGALQVASPEAFPPIPEGQSGRRELAQWISSADNPLTARVMANRVWQWLLGRGLVSTVDNFGSMGRPPSHPELLDHLAFSLIENDWSIKDLVREIATSRVYRLQTTSNDAIDAADPDNRWFARAHRRRLHAEDIRDALLAVSGTLDTSYGGSNIRPGTNSEYGYEFQSRRRSVYVPVFRNTLPQLFEVFDFPDPNIQSGERTTSTIASQALLLMNHPFVIEQAQAAAERLLARDLQDTPSRIDYAYRQVLGRSPTEGELAVMSNFIDSRADQENPSAAWAVLYQTLFQSIDFRHLN